MNSYKLLDKKNNPSLGFEAERYLLDEYNSEQIENNQNLKKSIHESTLSLIHI